MRLCDVTMFWSESGGGVRRYLEVKTDWLGRQSQAHEHLLVVPGERSARTVRGRSTTACVRGVRIPFAPGYRTPIGGGEVVRVLQDWSPAFVECGSPFLMRKAVGTYRSRTGTPVFDYYHAYFPRNYTAVLGRKHPAARRVLDAVGWAWLRGAYADSRRIFVASPVVKAELARHGITNTELAPLGVDLSLFRCKTPSEASTRPSILFAGRLTEEKGLSDVIECHSILRRSQDVTLTIVGDGVLRPRVEALAASDPLVRYLGFLPQPGLAAAYRQAWALVSAAPAETLGLCFLEALASGTPVAGLSGSGLLDSFPREVARAVAPASPETLAEATGSLLGSPPATEACRAAAEGYGWDSRLAHILSREISLSGREGCDAG